MSSVSSHFKGGGGGWGGGVERPEGRQKEIMERGKAEESIHTLHKENILAKEDKTIIYASEKLLPNCFSGILLQCCAPRPVPN